MPPKPYVKKISQCAVIFGCFLVTLPIGIPYCYGNLSTYTNSYFLYRVGYADYDVRPEWLVSLFLIAFVFGTFTVDWLKTKIDNRRIQFVAIVFFDIGLFSTHFSIQYSISLVTITLMLCGGYTAGVISMTGLIYASKVMPDHVGKASAFVASAFGVGAILNNYIITAYINPDKLTPDGRKSNMAYFSQTRVLDNVPGIFIVMGIFALGCHFLGYLLVQLILPLVKDNHCHYQAQDTDSPSVKKKMIEMNRTSDYQERATATDIVQMSNATPDCETNIDDDIVMDKKKNSRKEVESLSPFQVLHRRSFYLMWLSVVILTYGNFMTLNFFKQFAQLWIKDDTFLASVGSSSAMTLAGYRILTGILIDKIGVKNTLISALTINTIFMLFWYITARLDRWMYFFCCQTLIGVQGSIFLLFPMASLKLYGPRYYASNYGMILLANVATNFASPLIFSFLQDTSYYSWFNLTLIGSTSSAIVFLLIVCMMPADKKPAKVNLKSDIAINKDKSHR